MLNIEKLEDKYIELLLKRCIDLKNNPSLLISFIPENLEFVKKVEKRAYELGATNVILDVDDYIKYREELLNTDLEDIEKNPIFRRDKWNDNAKINGSFLLFTSLEPNYLEGVDLLKVKKAEYTRIASKAFFNNKRDDGRCSWCIAALPTIYWANQLFPNDGLAYEKLYSLILKMCMIDHNDPIELWDNQLVNSKKRVDILNDYQIESLNFKNSLGTNLTVYLPKEYKFCCAYKEDYYGIPIIVNMPSYEIYTSTIYNKTEGIVYSSKPLYYNNQKIDKFWLKFENGKVVDFDAIEGFDVLKRILEMEENSSYLGEVALVNYDSPISNTNMIFMETLFDENASCHLALGRGFPKTINVDKNLTEEEAIMYGINKANIHVDFMFGTRDLEVEAITRNKQKVKVFTAGNFDLKG